MHQHTLAARARRAGIILAAAVAALTLAACSAEPTSPAASGAGAPGDEALLTELGLGGMDARAIVDMLDATPLADRSQAFVASIRPDELIITGDDQVETSLPMPDDAFYVSIAPYVEQTHECYFHSLTTCTGEIKGSEVHVLVTDADTGEILIDEQRTTFDNGFVGLWLPRDVTATVTIEHDGLSATADVSTADSEDPTCITTMQLA